jgi:hypothetical protein
MYQILTPGVPKEEQDRWYASLLGTAASKIG